jgi:hypothetical protein
MIQFCLVMVIERFDDTAILNLGSHYTWKNSSRRMCCILEVKITMVIAVNYVINS